MASWRPTRSHCLRALAGTPAASSCSVHGGHTAVPRAGQPALAFLEQSVIAAFPPGQGEAGAVFHPKVWVLRYVARDGPVRYRLVCQSRNLTFDSVMGLIAGAGW